MHRADGGPGSSLEADQGAGGLGDWVDVLTCPENGDPLALRTRAEAERSVGAPLAAGRTVADDGSGGPAPIGPTPWVLLRADSRCAYPVVDGVPILLAPEALRPAGTEIAAGLHDPKYAEAYAEMTFYNDQGTREAEDVRRSEAYAIVEPVWHANLEERATFPEPRRVWIDAVYECAAQWDAYQHIAPLEGKRILQLGGTGSHGIKFVLGGAAEAWLVTPMLGEARCGLALARQVGMSHRFRCVVGVAEELPLASDRFDAIYAGGSLHHTVTAAALPEAARVLKPGGRFAAVDPWRAPFYSVGIAVFGKREPDVHCRPLTRARIAPLLTAFPSHRRIQHGTLTRYPLLALGKLGVPCGLSLAWRLTAIDDAVCSWVPGLRGRGSAVALLGTKTEAT